MASRKHQPIIIPAPRPPSPTESWSSGSSSSTYVSCNPSPPPSPPPSKPALLPAQMYSTSAPRSRRVSPPQTLLGAIDENSGAVLPDIPVSPDNKNNPVTKLHVYSAILTSKKTPTLAPTSDPPPDVLNMLVGPNGEKFTDMRMNRKAADSKKGGFKRFMCFS